jgi:RNA polymerase sigma-70 factor, ECF subfamily
MNPSLLSDNELLRLCLHSIEADAWNEFVHRFQRPIALVALRTLRMWGVASSSRADDITQEVFLRLCADDCKLLHRFVGDQPASLIAYIKVIAAGVAHDHLRASSRKKRGGNLEMSAEDFRDLESHIAAPAQELAVERAIQIREIEDVLASFVPKIITERDRTIFHLYFKQGFTARDIGSIASIGLSVKGVESSIHRTTSELRKVFGKHVPESQRLPGVVSDF